MAMSCITVAVLCASWQVSFIVCVEFRIVCSRLEVVQKFCTSLYGLDHYDLLGLVRGLGLCS